MGSSSERHLQIVVLAALGLVGAGRAGREGRLQHGEEEEEDSCQEVGRGLPRIKDAFFSD